jgi:murein DD-endopeptidase MepM/ murein hydrolase activator NlpD
MLIKSYYKDKIVGEKLKYLNPEFISAGMAISSVSGDFNQNATMRYRISALSIIYSCLVCTGWTQSGFPEDYFRAPLDIRMVLSGNFGELRPNHFHSGIDIKTQGVSGQRVYAAADGYISRIKIEAAGYGNTLYITHPGGFTTVYAHLDRFRSDIARYVKDRQYSLEQHALNIYPERDEWPVKKGELVAFSGTSGYSFGPHLHFEIRDAATQEPMNVLRFGFDIEDLVPPKIFSLYLYPGNSGSMANQSYSKTRLEVSGENGKYRLRDGDTVTATGSIGFGIEAFDFLNGAANRCGLYRIRMMVDGQLKYEWKMDRYSFSEDRYVNSYMDFGEKVRNNITVQKTFVDPNNRLDLYEHVENSGMIDFSEPRSYPVKFILEDAAENSSELGFVVRGGTPAVLPEREAESQPDAVFSWSADNEFSRDGISLKIPEGALYTDLKFHYAASPRVAGTFSPVHALQDPYTPLHLACDLNIRPDGLPEELQDKSLIALLDDENGFTAAGGQWQDGMVTTQIREFGRYAVLVDTTEPVISSLDLGGPGDRFDGKTIRFRVTDDLSGIKSYEGYIDNHWALFEYDTKNDLVYYRIDPKRLSSGKAHELELYITDNKENIAYFYAEFFW